jgi:hypothetical protein
VLLELHAKTSRANANSIPAAAWSLMHIIADHSLLRRIRSEIAPAFSSDYIESANMTRLNKYPLLQSVVAEVLRLRVAVMVNRVSLPSMLPNQA